MRNRVCLALGVLCTLAGTPSLAQVRTGSVMERKVTVTFNQAPLESVLHTLRRQYGLRISYSNTALNLRQPVTLNVQNQPLRSVLDQLLRDKNIGYELVGDQIVLHSAATKPRPAAKPTDATPAPASKPTPGPKAEAPASREEAAARVAPKAAATSAKPASKAVASAAAGSKKSGGAAVSIPASKPATTPASAKPTPPAPGASSDAATPTASAAATPAVPTDSVASEARSETSDASTANQAAGAVGHGQFTKTAQVSFFGPLGSNGLRSGQTVNKLSLNLLAGYAAG
ncbi:DUF4974 domain-containing protein [Hymenobacter sediminis]|uniref:DUF4974 domain-containing protein n=1 Tax=Hymenobacter sediminis TaxID=2218621 RepID=UPI000DA6524B|nr:DUF4974 domain-containing protein [Hymenobacter sediminis]RPD47848.1 DUF4974 domain-containing protein [Hymenobacter sediminis]